MEDQAETQPPVDAERHAGRVANVVRQGVSLPPRMAGASSRDQACLPMVIGSADVSWRSPRPC